MVGCLNDFKKLSFISTVGGFVSNREIERMSTRKICKDVIHSLFSFFMALFCQVFSGFKLNQQFVPMVEFVDDKRLNMIADLAYVVMGMYFKPSSTKLPRMEVWICQHPLMCCTRVNHQGPCIRALH